jgi:large subunit ribosomal protein L10
LPISREQKETLIAALAEDLSKTQAIILTDYRGLPTAELAGLRNQLRGMKSGLHIAKNTLLALALERAEMPVPQDLLEGPTAVAFCYGDIAGPAKALNDFLKGKDIGIKGAIMSGSVLRGAEAAALASLPSREQLFGRLLGTINAPGTQAAGVVAAGIRQILYALKSRIEQLEKQSPTPLAG